MTIVAVEAATPGSTPRPPTVVGLAGRPSDTRRGGDLRVLLSPKTADSTSGFMGHVSVEPGGSVAEHYHPYSEEFLFVVQGRLVVRVNGEAHTLEEGQAILVPPFNRHRLENHGDVTANAVFHLGPLAPRPELGHVDTETLGNVDTETLGDVDTETLGNVDTETTP